MFYSLILENENGDRIDLSKIANKYMTSEIDGLYPPNGTISTGAILKKWTAKEEQGIIKENARRKKKWSERKVPDTVTNSRKRL